MADQPKMRSINFLTPEQLKKKRDGDKLAQRHKRERARSNLETLRRQLQELQRRNQTLEDWLSSTNTYSRSPYDRRSETAPGSTLDERSDSSYTCVAPQSGDAIGSSSIETLPVTAVSSTTRESGTSENEIWQMLHGNFPDLGTWAVGHIATTPYCYVD